MIKENEAIVASPGSAFQMVPNMQGIIILLLTLNLFLSKDSIPLHKTLVVGG